MSIASASTTVKFHEFPSGNVLHNYQPGTQVHGPIRSISWSKDGNWLALVPYSGLAEIVSVKDQLKLIHTIHGIEEPSCAAFQNATKKNIAVGTKSGQVLIYDIKARSVKKRYPRTTSLVSRVEFTARDCHIVAACDNGEAHIYSNIHNNLSGSFKIPRSQSISALRTNPIQRNYVVAGSNEGVVAVWDIHRNKNKFFIGAHKASVTAVAFSPVNSDLVVSTGLDRQFCFYDIGANKCIGNIFVENSMTAVDFSPDGKFVVLGSQKGYIYIYDSKNIQQPLYSFVAHNSCIEHLSFRKCEDYETSFLSSEDCKDSKTAENCLTSESVATDMILDDMIFGHQTARSVCSEKSVEDSFLAAIGMDQNNSAESSCRPSESSKKLLMHKFTPTIPSKLLQDRPAGDQKIPMTSTPDFLIHGLHPQDSPKDSPITNFFSQPAPEPNKTNLMTVEDMVKSTVKEELKVITDALNNMKQDMKYQSFDILEHQRQIYLELVMVMVKESIKVENNFNTLRADLLTDVPQNQGSLIQENFMLKQKIAALEEELAILKSNKVNANM